MSGIGGAGEVNKPFIVAELSANHLGSLDRAFALVDAAAKAGADAVKLQTYTPEQMADSDTVIESGPWAGRNLLDLYREARTPREWHKPLFDRARELGLIAFSSVFHPDDVDFLETLDCPMYKISSFEILDLNLVMYAASKGKQVIISTGMAGEEDIDIAISAAREVDSEVKMTLLKCTSAYPTPFSECNLIAMNDLREWGFPVGISDHTLGWVAPVVATAFGAAMIEKHLTLSRADGGPDAGFSMEPNEFAAMVKACREAAEAIGEIYYGPTPSEASSLSLRRKSGGKRG